MYVSHFSKRVLIIGALAAVGPAASLTACEGEPPVNAPENAAGTASVSLTAPPAASQEPAATTSAALTPTACPPPPCAPVATSLASASTSPATSAPADSAAALPVPPPSIPRGNVVGAVTTKPPTLVGQAVVYLEDGPKEDQPSHLQAVTIANRQMNFIPYVSVAAVGAKVVFTNEDPFPHNVFSPDGDKFNMGNIPQNGAHVRVFKNPGAFSLLCNLHPGMLGYLLVTPSTWFARADAKGHFTMKHVPSGTYQITAWAPRQAPVTESVTVADGDVTVNFDLHR
ncbi:MAG TPA: carboxypeptidase regulatory-like domain-containing protein [Polyangiaceae bacterium]|nr:carboxypeptidase regulatory-like domain-containing protein [Polyangiaceae bacterium]